MMILQYLFFLYIFILTIILIYINIYKFRKKILNNQIKEFIDYETVLQYHMDLAYNIIYREYLLIYSLESIKISKEQLSEITKQYVLLVFKFIGKNLKKEFEFLHGSEENLIFFIGNYFQQKYDNDTLLKIQREALIDTEIQ